MSTRGEARGARSVNERAGRILLVEDELIQREQLAKNIVAHGHDVAVAGSLAEVDAAGALDAFDLIIADLRLPDGAGTDLVRKAKACGTPVLIITAYAGVRSAVEAMKLGARDYLPKPFATEELLLIVEQLVVERIQSLRLAALERDVREAWPVEGMIGNSPKMQEVRRLIAKVAPAPPETTVLIRGESGTGKELVARAIHNASPRRDAPLVSVNVGAITKELIASELFGCEQGAHNTATKARSGLFEAAHGGTLFLDEIGELSAEAQVCLLRVLEDKTVRRLGGTKERRVNVRVLAATNRSHEELARDGALRKDLYFRLSFKIEMPPLRERGADIEALARHLMKRMATSLGKGDVELTSEALAAVRAYHWPGNVRELKNAVERGAILCDTGRITPEELGIETSDGSASEGPASGDEARDAHYRRVILANQATMSETKLAKLLKITRTGLYRVRLRLGLPRPPRKS